MIELLKVVRNVFWSLKYIEKALMTVYSQQLILFITFSTQVMIKTFIIISPLLGIDHPYMNLQVGSNFIIKIYLNILHCLNNSI